MARIKNISNYVVPIPETHCTLRPGEDAFIDDHTFERSIRIPRLIQQKMLQVLVPPRSTGYLEGGRVVERVIVKEKEVGTSKEAMLDMAKEMAREMIKEFAQNLPTMQGQSSTLPAAPSANNIQLDGTVVYLPDTEIIDKNFEKLEVTKVDQGQAVSSAAEALRRLKKGDK